jgi:uncharacterized protein (DUF885 family)
LSAAPGGRLAVERLTFHEGIPGHHLQVALATERSGTHPVVQLLANPAFDEGWANYAERLADEMGLYSSAATRLTALANQLSLAATVVEETGVHVRGWTRQQAIDYHLAHTPRTPEQAAQSVDRRIGWPGQSLAYELGGYEIWQLRQEAKRGLGPAFDIRAFHERVLGRGSITLPMLREGIGAWTAERRKEARGPTN